MGHPAPNKDKCERGVEEKPWRGGEAKILGEVSKLLVRRKNLSQFNRSTHTTKRGDHEKLMKQMKVKKRPEVVVEECC